MRSHFLFRLFSAALLTAASAQVLAAETFWREVPEARIESTGERWISPAEARTMQFDLSGIKRQLLAAPTERSVSVRQSDLVINLPTPDAQTARFAVVASGVMEPGLAAKFPEIQTYIGQGLDDPTATLQLSINQKGLFAQILSAHGDFYIDPFQVNDSAHYVVYWRRGMGDTGKRYRCETDGLEVGAHSAADHDDGGKSLPTPFNPAGTSLRTYRLAMVSTSSYTNAFGGTVADGLAGLTTLVSRLNGVYERDFAVRLVLVANNDLIVYTNSNVGPIGAAPSGPDPVIQTTIDTAIGSANYDLGHAVGGSGGGGAITPLGNVCGSSKARGFTSLSPPRGDIFDIDFVAHELGHQLGGSHTWNGCGGGGQWTATSAQEPGSASTIMGYAGICPDNLQPNSDAYFHARSFTQIWQIINNGGSGNGNTTCGTVTATGNNPPNITAPANFTIPERTPFELTATGNDPDVGDVVLYNWEQVDTGAQGSPSTTGDNGTAPLFRSFNSTTSPKRVFPSLIYILDNDNTPPATITLPPAGGTYLPAEILPNPASGTRVMNFRATARDNRAGGGGLRHTANVQVTAVAAAGPFLVGAVTSPQTGGSSLAVTWSVASTDIAPINTTQVNILLSLDGGYTFSPLLSGTANDGAETVTLPSTATARARIRVEAANGTGIAPGNTYFDISNSFAISTGGAAVSVTVSTLPADLIAVQQGSPAPAPKNVATISGGTAPYTVSAAFEPPTSEISVQSLQVSGNTISATATASCLVAAPNLPSFRVYPAVLKVVDSLGSQATAALPINVSNNSLPTLGTYANQSVAPGNSVVVSPSAGPADPSGNLTGVSVSPATLPGGGTVTVDSSGVVTVNTVAGTTLGAHTIKVSVDDGCGARTSESFTLNVVSPNPVIAFSSSTVTTGNGILEPQECNDLNVLVNNTGGGTASVVSAVLSTSTPGVSVFQANSAYPDIPANGSASNTTPYQVSTDPGLACGGTASFTHTVTFTGGGPTALNFTLPIGEPPAANYTFATQSGQAAPTGSSLVASSQDDDAIVNVTLPSAFTFSIYGTPVTSLRADTNGILIFNAGGASSTATNTALPSAAYAAPSLFAFWDDLDMSTTAATGGGIYTQVNGTAPNRTFDVQWKAVRWQSSIVSPITPTVDFTIRLHETTNLIEIVYSNVTGNGGGGSGSSATVGIQAAGTGTIFTQFSSGSASLSAGLKLTASRAAGNCVIGPVVCGGVADGVFANGFE